MLPYENLAKFYQKIILDKSYDEWTDYLLSLIKDKLPFGSCYDVGCGTGIFTRKLKSLGYDVIGVDLSFEMLAVARELTSKSKQNIEYINCDMKSLKSLKKLDFITVVNDGLNYVEQKDIKRTFKAFNSCLKKGGFIVFDVSSSYKLKNLLASNMYGDNGEELSYIWLNELSSDNKSVNMSLSFFEKQGDFYKRYDEEQTQFIHEVNDIILSLCDAGFEVKSVTNAFGKELTDIDERILFIATKK